MADLPSDQIDKEILPLMSSTARPNVRGMAMEYFLGMSGSEDGRKFIASNTKYLDAIVAIFKDEHQPIAKDAYLAIVNLSAAESVAAQLLLLPEHPDFLLDLIKYTLDEKSPHADIACMAVSNISRWERTAQQMMDVIVKNQSVIGLDKIVRVFCTVNHNKDAKLHYLGPVLSNLTQIREARKYILDKERCVIQRLLTFIDFKDSIVRRGGIIGTLRNCCFELEYHEWLLSDKVDILPRLVLPLAGPEELDDVDMELLPDDLQYLEPDKTREPDPDMRKMLIESIQQLCTTKKIRMYIKEKNIYVILREYHKWEKDPACDVAVTNAIHILIGDEPEPGMENLSEVEIPEKVKAGLEKTQEQIDRQIEEEYKKLDEQGDTTVEENSAPSEND